MEAPNESNTKQAITITLCSTKGGPGKTTLAANLGGLLAALNFKVLLIDGDIQPGLSSYYLINHHAQFGSKELMKHEQDSLSCISTTTIKNLDIVISNGGDELQTWINTNPAGRITLTAAIKPLRDHYDFIIIDSQGADSAIQHATVLAGDLLISPIPPDIISSQEFQRGTLKMLEKLIPFSSMINSPLGQLYGLVYRKDRTKDAKIFSDELTSMTFKESKTRIRILNTFIPHLVAYKNAASKHVPVHTIDKGAKASMCELVSEILPNLSKQCNDFMEVK